MKRLLCLALILLLSSCSSSPSVPSDVKDKNVWNQGYQAYQVLMKTVAKEYTPMTSKDEDVIINFVNSYPPNQSSYSKVESTIVRYVNSSYKSYKASMNTANTGPGGMDRYSDAQNAKRAVSELGKVYESK
ncbi:hypothetical protein [Paenibacillus validus]|uniref:hypothetical protein n=2 Tax=Paenibacillus validus TaxID=44253 RepID=UPI003D2C7BE9